MTALATALELNAPFELAMDLARTTAVVAMVEQLDLPSYIMKSTDSQLVSKLKAGAIYTGVARAADVLRLLCAQ